MRMQKSKYRLSTQTPLSFLQYFTISGSQGRNNKNIEEHKGNSVYMILGLSNRIKKNKFQTILYLTGV